MRDNVQDRGQVNNIEISDGGKVTIKPNQGVNASSGTAGDGGQPPPAPRRTRGPTTTRGLINRIRRDANADDDDDDDDEEATIEEGDDAPFVRERVFTTTPRPSVSQGTQTNFYRPSRGQQTDLPPRPTGDSRGNQTDLSFVPPRVVSRGQQFDSRPPSMADAQTNVVLPRLVSRGQQFGEPPPATADAQTAAIPLRLVSRGQQVGKRPPATADAQTDALPQPERNDAQSQAGAKKKYYTVATQTTPSAGPTDPLIPPIPGLPPSPPANPAPYVWPEDEPRPPLVVPQPTDSRRPQTVDAYTDPPPSSTDSQQTEESGDEDSLDGDDRVPLPTESQASEQEELSQTPEDESAPAEEFSPPDVIYQEGAHADTRTVPYAKLDDGVGENRKKAVMKDLAKKRLGAIKRKRNIRFSVGRILHGPSTMPSVAQTRRRLLRAVKERASKGTVNVAFVPDEEETRVQDLTEGAKDKRSTRGRRAQTRGQRPKPYAVERKEKQPASDNLTEGERERMRQEIAERMETLEGNKPKTRIDRVKELARRHRGDAADTPAAATQRERSRSPVQAKKKLARPTFKTTPAKGRRRYNPVSSSKKRRRDGSQSPPPSASRRKEELFPPNKLTTTTSARASPVRQLSPTRQRRASAPDIAVAWTGAAEGEKVRQSVAERLEKRSAKKREHKETLSGFPDKTVVKEKKRKPVAERLEGKSGKTQKSTERAAKKRDHKETLSGFPDKTAVKEKKKKPSKKKAG